MCDDFFLHQKKSVKNDPKTLDFGRMDPQSRLMISSLQSRGALGSVQLRLYDEARRRRQPFQTAKNASSVRHPLVSRVRLSDCRVASPRRVVFSHGLNADDGASVCLYSSCVQKADSPMFKKVRLKLSGVCASSAAKTEDDPDRTAECDIVTSAPPSVSHRGQIGRRQMASHPESLLLYGTTLLSYEDRAPCLRVYPQKDKTRLRDATCEWLDVTPLAGTTFPSLNKAGEALRRLKHGGGTSSTRLSVNVWEHLLVVLPDGTKAILKSQRERGFASL